MEDWPRAASPAELEAGVDELGVSPREAFAELAGGVERRRGSGSALRDGELRELDAGLRLIIVGLCQLLGAPRLRGSPGRRTILACHAALEARAAEAPAELEESRRAWPEVREALAAGIRASAGESSRFELEFDARTTKLQIRDAAMLRALRRLVNVDRELGPDQLGTVYESLLDRQLGPARDGSLALRPDLVRRRFGAHYTPASLSAAIVERALDAALTSLGPRPTPAQLLGLRICDPAVGAGAFLLASCRQLGDRLVEAWRSHGPGPELGEDGETSRRRARSLVASRCLYGVDRDPLALALAELALAEIGAPTNTNTSRLACGDSLLGLSRRQIASFHWTEGDRPFAGLAEDRQAAKLLADALLATWFCADDAGKAEIEARRRSLAAEARRWRGGDQQGRRALERAAAELCARGLAPLHWPLAFPELDERGFSIVLGNPPFLGSVRLAAVHGPRYTAWLRRAHAGARGKADLAAFFLRRGFEVLATPGVLAMLGTKTLREGDTRRSGLSAIVEAGGVIIDAQPRLPWPGDAAVTACSVHVWKGPDAPAPRLAGREVERISAMLRPSGPDRCPPPLPPRFLCSLGNKPGAKGFVFSERGGDYASEAELEALRADRSAAAFIRPYLVGDDLLRAAPPRPRRHIVDLNHLDADDDRWQAEAPALHAHLRRRVGEHGRRGPWWQFARRAVELRAALAAANFERIFAAPETGKHLCIVAISPRWCSSNTVVNFLSDADADFAVLQSRIHELWARSFSSSFEDRLRYVPRQAFANFPWPAGSGEALADAGRAYLAHRRRLVRERGLGLTKLYNRFHDPRVQERDIETLRRLHAALDRATLLAYGWPELAERAQPEFRPDPAGEPRLRLPGELEHALLDALLELHGRSLAADAH